MVSLYRFQVVFPLRIVFDKFSIIRHNLISPKEKLLSEGEKNMLSRILSPNLLRNGFLVETFV